ncbi:19781_t:CDS:2, partial [Racocetra persica]
SLDIENKNEGSSDKKTVSHLESALIKEIQKILLNTNQEIGGGTSEEILTKDAFEKIQQNLIKWGFNDFYHFLGVDKNIEKKELRSACVKKIKEYQGAIGIKTDEKTKALFQLATETKKILSLSAEIKNELARSGVKTEELMDYFGLGKMSKQISTAEQRARVFLGSEIKVTYREGMMVMGESCGLKELQTILDSALQNIGELEKQKKEEEIKIRLEERRIKEFEREKQNTIPDFLFDQAKKRIQKELGKHYDKEKDCPENDRESVFKDVQSFIGKAKNRVKKAATEEIDNVLDELNKMENLSISLNRDFVEEIWGAENLEQVDNLYELASTEIKKEVINFLQVKIVESEISQAKAKSENFIFPKTPATPGIPTSPRNFQKKKAKEFENQVNTFLQRFITELDDRIIFFNLRDGGKDYYRELGFTEGEDVSSVKDSENEKVNQLREIAASLRKAINNLKLLDIDLENPQDLLSIASQWENKVELDKEVMKEIKRRAPVLKQTRDRLKNELGQVVGLLGQDDKKEENTPVIEK